jgi:hypothetical protein
MQWRHKREGALQFYMMTPDGVQMLHPTGSDDANSIGREDCPLGFLGRARNILLASLDNRMIHEGERAVPS